MKVLGYLNGITATRDELQRSARLLNLESEIAFSDRQVIRIAEDLSDRGERALVVTTDAELALLRELQARSPRIQVLLLTSRRFTELPYFLSLSPIVKGFFISPTGNCGANYFVNFLRQESRSTPFTLAEHLGPGNKVIALEFDDPQSQGEVIAKARAFFLWCLGDPQDPSNIQRSRQLEDSLNELLANVVRHGCKAAAPAGPINAEVHLGFDGVLVGICVKDPFGSMRRHNLLESLAADPAALRRLGETDPPAGGRGYKMILEKKQRIVVNLHENVSTEVICITRLSSRNVDDLGQPSSLEIRSWPRFCA